MLIWAFIGLCAATLMLYLDTCRCNRNLTAVADDMLTHAVWRDEFGQWWNVYRRESFATEAGAETDLRIRLAEALS